MSTPRSTSRTIFKLFGMYWTKSGFHETTIAVALAVSTLGFSYLSVDVLVEFSNWQREFIDIFQKVGAIVLQNADRLTLEVLGQFPGIDQSDPAKFAYEKGQKFLNLPEMKEQFDEFVKKLTVDFPIVVGKYVATAVLAFTSAQHLALRWRTWITGKFTNEWLNGAYYKIKTAYSHIDNPDQRIQEDLDNICDGLVSIATEGLEAALKLTAFSTILYQFGSFNPAVVGGPHLNIDGYLFWTALTYAVIGTGVLWGIARTLPGIFRDKQVAEGTFRAGLISVHENSEQIALSRGEECEKSVLREKFNAVVDVTKKYINKRKQMILFNSIHANIGSIIPYLASAPLFFAGQITLGAISQTAYAFRQVENSFSFFMNNIHFFSSMKANFDRLGTLHAAIELSHAQAEKQKRVQPETILGMKGPV